MPSEAENSSAALSKPHLPIGTFGELGEAVSPSWLRQNSSANPLEPPSKPVMASVPPPAVSTLLPKASTPKAAAHTTALHANGIRTNPSFCDPDGFVELSLVSEGSRRGVAGGVRRI